MESKPVISQSELETIADALSTTLGSMPAEEADKVVEVQMFKLYELAGLKVVPSKEIKTRRGGFVCFRKDVLA